MLLFWKQCLTRSPPCALTIRAAAPCSRGASASTFTTVCTVSLTAPGRTACFHSRKAVVGRAPGCLRSSFSLHVSKHNRHCGAHASHVWCRSTLQRVCLTINFCRPIMMMTRTEILGSVRLGAIFRFNRQQNRGSLFRDYHHAYSVKFDISSECSRAAYGRVKSAKAA